MLGNHVQLVVGLGIPQARQLIADMKAIAAAAGHPGLFVMSLSHTRYEEAAAIGVDAMSFYNAIIFTDTDQSTLIPV